MEGAHAHKPLNCNCECCSIRKALGMSSTVGDI